MFESLFVMLLVVVSFWGFDVMLMNCGYVYVFDKNKICICMRWGFVSELIEWFKVN